MTITHLYAWALAIMVHLQPVAPWFDTYTDTAYAVVDEAEAHPLFPGADGVARTIALHLAVQWYESRFRPDARGDHGQSLGAYQISRVHAPAADLLRQTSAAAIANRLFARSRLICGSRPAAESLGWYAGGGNGCGTERARRQSRHRWALAARILRDVPPPSPRPRPSESGAQRE